MADGEIHIADPVRESLARATISAAIFRTANPSWDSAIRSARFLVAGACPDITLTSERMDQADGHWPVGGAVDDPGGPAGLSWRGRAPADSWQLAACRGRGAIGLPHRAP